MSYYYIDMVNTKRYSLEELGQLTELSPRTIRSYIQKGLLSGPESRGRNASYTEAHLDRLQCMQVIRDKSGLTLDELRKVMQALSEEQIHKIGSGQEEVMALPIGQAEPSSFPRPVFACEEMPYRRKGKVSTMEAEPGYRPAESTNALDYIRQIRGKTRSDESRFADLIRTLEGLTDGQRIYRKAKNEFWATVKVTEDMEIRVRGLDAKDIGQLERLADLLRHLVMKGV